MSSTPRPLPPNTRYSEEFLRGYRRGLVDGLDEGCGCDNEPVAPAATGPTAGEPRPAKGQDDEAE